MRDIDFTACEFIRNELCFLTYVDFCFNAKIIKLFYEAMENTAKIFYKWYVYANIHMTEYFKDRIWDYLNNPDEEYYQNLIECLPKYKVR